jgi:hypothetical protein
MLSDRIACERDPVWYRRVGVLLRRDRMFEFWPNPMHTRAEKVNAIVRFALYASVAAYLTSRRPRYLLVGFVSILAISLAHARMPDPVPAAHPAAAMEGPQGTRGIRKPTPDNPFGNPLAGTSAHGDGLRNPPADTEDGTLEAQRDALAQKGLFMNFEDAWKAYSAERQYYTLPDHDTGAFAQFLYGDMDKSMETRAKKTSHYG